MLHAVAPNRILSGGDYFTLHEASEAMRDAEDGKLLTLPEAGIYAIPSLSYRLFHKMRLLSEFARVDPYSGQLGRETFLAILMRTRWEDPFYYWATTPHGLPTDPEMRIAHYGIYTYAMTYESAVSHYFGQWEPGKGDFLFNVI